MAKLRNWKNAFIEPQESQGKKKKSYSYSSVRYLLNLSFLCSVKLKFSLQSQGTTVICFFQFLAGKEVVHLSFSSTQQLLISVESLLLSFLYDAFFPSYLLYHLGCEKLLTNVSDGIIDLNGPDKRLEFI